MIVEPARIVRGDLGQRRKAALVALDGDDPAGARGEQRARQSARARADLDDRHAGKVAGGARDRAVRLRSSRKFWPSAFDRREPVAGDDLAQRRQRRRSALMRSGFGRGVSSAGEPQRRREARRVGPAAAGDVERRAVVGRGADEGQAERDVDRLVEGERLGRDQRLVVIHAERHVVAGARRRDGTCVSAGSGPNGVDALGAASASTAGADDPLVLAAHRAAFAGMRVEPGDREPRLADAEAAPEIGGDDRGPSRRSARSVSAAGTSRSGTWIVTGTVAQLRAGEHHHRLSPARRSRRPRGARGIRCGRDGGSRRRRAPSC